MINDHNNLLSLENYREDVSSKKITSHKLLKRLAYFCQTIVVVLFLVSQTLFASDSALVKVKAGGPKIFIKSMTYDAGLVKAGDKVKGIFLIENQGDSSLVIKKVAPT